MIYLDHYIFITAGKLSLIKVKAINIYEYCLTYIFISGQQEAACMRAECE